MELEQLDQLASQLKARRQQGHGQQHHGGGLTILISGANRYDTLLCCLPNAKSLLLTRIGMLSHVLIAAAMLVVLSSWYTVESVWTQPSCLLQ